MSQNARETLREIRQRRNSDTDSADAGDAGSGDGLRDAFERVAGGVEDVVEGAEETVDRATDDTDTTTDTTTADEVTESFEESGADVRDADDPVRTGGAGPEPTAAEQQNIDAATAEASERLREEQQGVETDAGRVAEQARALEERVVANRDTLGAEDVRVTRDGNRLRAQLTSTGREALGANPTRGELRAQAAAELGVDAENVSLTTRNGTTRARVEMPAVDGAGEFADDVASGAGGTAQQIAQLSGLVGAAVGAAGAGGGDRPEPLSSPVRGAQRAVRADFSDGIRDPLALATPAAARRAQRKAQALNRATQAAAPVPSDERFGDFRTDLPPGVSRALPNNPQTAEGVLDDAIAASGRAGRQAGRTIGGLVGAGADTAATAVTNPSALVDVRSGPIQPGDQGFRVSPGRNTFDAGERAGRDFGEAVGSIAAAGPQAVKATDEVVVEPALAAAQEAPGLLRPNPSFDPTNAVDVREGPIQPGNRGFRIRVGDTGPAVRSDLASEIESLTNSVAASAGEQVRGLGVGPFRINDQRVRAGDADNVNLPLVGDRAERAIDTVGRTIVGGGASERVEEGPLIQTRPGRAPEAFGTLTGGAALIGLEAAAGTAATRGLQTATRRGAALARRRNAEVVVDAEDLVSPTQREQVLQANEQPEFETPTDAPTEAAVREFRRRAAENPNALAEAVASGRVLLRSEADRLPGGLEAGRGNFELPGLFTSADLAPLRAQLGGAAETARTELRLPRPSDFTPRDRDQFSAFFGDDIEGLPDRAAESGFATGPDGETVPDPDAAGTRFLDEEADRGTAFVRATGDRTPELEAVFPPETEFVRQGTGLVRLPGGDTADIDLFRRPEDAVRRVSGGAAGVSVRGPDADTDTVTARDLADRGRRRDGSETPDTDPVTPTAPTADGTETVAQSETASTAGVTTSNIRTLFRPGSRGGSPRRGSTPSIPGGISTASPSFGRTPTDSVALVYSASIGTPVGSPGGGLGITTPVDSPGGPGSPGGGGGTPRGPGRRPRPDLPELDTAGPPQRGDEEIVREGVGETDADLLAGFAAETVTDISAGGTATVEQVTASEAELETALEAGAFAGELPTGAADTAAFEEAADLFSFGGGR